MWSHWLVNYQNAHAIPSMFYKVNYPGQFLDGENPVLITMRGGYYRFVRIKKIEILKRRDTTKKKCSEEPLPYDQMIIKEHIKAKGCCAPYLRVEELTSKCDLSTRLNESQFHFEIARTMDYPKDCQRMSEIRTSSTKSKKLKSLARKWRFGISYPDEVKIITQSKEIDIHTLIGNIGGYFGLFLGKNCRIMSQKY